MGRDRMRLLASWSLFVFGEWMFCLRPTNENLGMRVVLR